MKRLLKSPALYFLPFLLVYCLLIFWLDRHPLLGDGRRYLMFAENLCQGFYSPSERLNLWNGPGYPLFLVPFVALGLPLKSMVWANAFLLYGSIIYFFKASQFILSPQKAILAGIGIGFYFLITFREMSILAYESLTIFLVCSFLFYFVRAYNRQQTKDIWIAGFLIGYLVLTRIIFGYVLLALLFSGLFVYMFSKERQAIKKSLVLLTIGFLVVLPYLGYTFRLTGKFFYFGNSGGMQLYWMSSPYAYEYGDFNRLSPSPKKGRVTNEIGEITALRWQYLQQNHEVFFEELQSLNEIQKDAAFKKKALSQIKSNPGKYLKNIFANAGRLLFGIPDSYASQKVNVLFRIGLHSFLLVFMCICGLVSLLQWRRLEFSIRFILILTLIYLGGSLLVSGHPRFFYIVVPLLMFWIFYILEYRLEVRLKTK